MPDFRGANIHTVDALKDFRVALILFQERALTALGDVRQKIDRTVSWLEMDRPSYWRDQEHRAYDLLATTRIAYETCRLRTVGGRKSDCIEEKKAFERAKIRMEYVREKQLAVKKWMVQAGREANEYRARTSVFQRMLENEVPLLIAQMGRMIDAIEAYSEIQTTKADAASLTTSVPSTDGQVTEPNVIPEAETPAAEQIDPETRTDSDEG